MSRKNANGNPASRAGALTACAAALGVALIAAPASADHEFGRGFENEMGRIFAHAVFGAGVGFFHAAPPVVVHHAPPPVVVHHVPPPVVYHEVHYGGHRHYAGCGHGHYREAAHYGHGYKHYKHHKHHKRHKRHHRRHH